MTVLGEFVRPHGESAWTSTLIEALGSLNVKERNARQAIARLSDQGILRVEHHGRLAQWHLTSSGAALLKVGADRIYRFGTDAQQWDGRWLIVLCPATRIERSKRHQLRTRLAFEGFGFVSPEAAVSPHVDREHRADSILEALDLSSAALVLRAETGSFAPDNELLAQAWDLKALAHRYASFLGEYSTLQPSGREESFAATVCLVHAWRHFPFNDPEIPTELLPAGWLGGDARHVFESRRREWAEPAHGWYTTSEQRG